jgi:hypothetical protein
MPSPKYAKIEVLRSLGIDNPEDIISDLNRANCYYNITQGSGVDYVSGPSVCTPEVIPKTII